MELEWDSPLDLIGVFGSVPLWDNEKVPPPVSCALLVEPDLSRSLVWYANGEFLALELAAGGGVDLADSIMRRKVTVCSFPFYFSSQSNL